MTQTTKQMIEVDVPVGWRATGEQARYNDNNGKYIRVRLEPDPTYIDTSTIEYRLEVHRQWLRGKKIQCFSTDGKWVHCVDESYPEWRWEFVVYRVKPEATDELGPYYLDEGKKVYVPT